MAKWFLSFYVATVFFACKTSTVSPTVVVIAVRWEGTFEVTSCETNAGDAGPCATVRGGAISMDLTTSEDGRVSGTARVPPFGLQARDSAMPLEGSLVANRLSLRGELQQGANKRVVTFTAEMPGDRAMRGTVVDVSVQPLHTDEHRYSVVLSRN